MLRCIQGEGRVGREIGMRSYDVGMLYGVIFVSDIFFMVKELKGILENGVLFLNESYLYFCKIDFYFCFIIFY